ncbi:exosortase A [Kordiimonas aquimaris]|uniref:exosortase A n=1 Tax=Kordiimonas aquimaris TaxID=707591 RepID=UPI0021D3BC5D|nr:exosortase A [Kordiimonas aquimaris]
MTDRSKIAFAIMLFGLAITFYAWWSTVVHLVDLVQTVDVFAHGQIVPLVSIVLIWSRREMLRAIKPSFSIMGLVVLTGAVAIWLMGELLDSALFAHLGLITAIQGIVLFSFGTKIYRALLFPMGFLYLTIPFGYALVTHLQHLTANMVILVLDIIGADFTAEGVLIELPSGLYEVAQACAGIRFLFTSVVTSILLANLVFESWKRRVMILCVGVILPIVANIIRVLSILAIAEMTDQSFAKDVDHLIYGWVFLSIVLLALISFAYRVSDIDIAAGRIEQKQEQHELDHHKFSIFGVSLFFLPLFASYVFPSQFEPVYQEGQQENTALYQVAPNGYRLINRPAKVSTPKFLNADVERQSVLRENSVVFSVYASTYNALGPGRRLYQSGNSLTSHDWEELTGLRQNHAEICGQHVEERIFRRGEMRIMVWSMYRLNEAAIASSLEEKLFSAYARFKEMPAVGEAVVLTASVADDLEVVRKTFSGFIKKNLHKNGLWSDAQTKVKGTRLCAE